MATLPGYPYTPTVLYIGNYADMDSTPDNINGDYVAENASSVLTGVTLDNSEMELVTFKFNDSLADSYISGDDNPTWPNDYVSVDDGGTWHQFDSFITVNITVSYDSDGDGDIDGTRTTNVIAVQLTNGDVYLWPNFENGSQDSLDNLGSIKSLVINSVTNNNASGDGLLYDHTTIGSTTVVCFVRGTRILMADHREVAIEDLKIGDLVLTKDNGPQPIRWIGSRTIDSLLLRYNENLRPIRVKKGALGGVTPTSDLLLSPHHRVLVRSDISKRMFGTREVLVAVKHLLQVEGIDIATDIPSVQYFHILFDRHEVITSNGAEAESLYTGPEAIKALPQEALDEVYAVFPELRDRDYRPPAARILPPGRHARKLASRVIENRKPLVVSGTGVAAQL